VGFLVTVAVLVSAPPSGGAQARLGEARAAIVRAERARGAEVLEDPAALVAEGWTAEKNLGFFGKAAQLVSDGRRALARVELDKAEALLAQAESVYGAESARPGVAAEWALAATWHGVVLFELKRREEANRAWARAKSLVPDEPLTEAMVRPEVAKAFAAVGPSARGSQEPSDLPTPTAAEIVRRLGLDELVRVAIAIDAGTLTYAAARLGDGCASDVIVATNAEELVRRVNAATCRSGVVANVEGAEPIAHPRAAVVQGGARGASDHRTAVWRKPWLWAGVVGAIGVGVVLGVTLWPRQASYSAGLDYHAFALEGR